MTPSSSSSRHLQIKPLHKSPVCLAGTVSILISIIPFICTPARPTTHLLETMKILLFEENFFFFIALSLPRAHLSTQVDVCNQSQAKSVNPKRLELLISAFYFQTFEKADCTIFALSVGWPPSIFLLLYSRKEQKKYHRRWR